MPVPIQQVDKTITKTVNQATIRNITIDVVNNKITFLVGFGYFDNENKLVTIMTKTFIAQKADFEALCSTMCTAESLYKNIYTTCYGWLQAKGHLNLNEGDIR